MPIKSSRMDVDIITQSLSQLIVRPKYGAVIWTAMEGALPPNATTYGIAIYGKGMIYEIKFYGYSTGVIDNDYWSALIDGNAYDGPPMSHFRDYNFQAPFSPGPYMCLSDDVNYKYAGGTNMGITFENSYILGYTETYGKPMYLYIRIMYALLTS